MTTRRPRARAQTGDSTPGGNYTQLFVDLIDAGNAQAQLILKAVAQHADWKSGVCHPRCRSLAEIAKCSIKTVRRYLRQMQADGILELDGRFDEAGRRTSNEITLVGYAEWASAIRCGGVVAAPRIVRKYDAPPGQSDQGPPGQFDQYPLDSLSPTGPGQSDQYPLVNLTRGTGHLVSTLNEPSLELQREGESGAGAEFEQVLQGLRTGYPEYRHVIERLIEPLLRRRLLARAPDPVFALGAVAKQAAMLSNDVLDDAVDIVAAERDCTFKPSDVEKALKAAVANARRTAAMQRPAAAPSGATDPEIAAKGEAVRAALQAQLGSDVFASWFSGIEFERVEAGRVVASVGVKFLKTYIEQHFAAELEACTRAVFADIERVDLIVRRQVPA